MWKSTALRGESGCTFVWVSAPKACKLAGAGVREALAHYPLAHWSMREQPDAQKEEGRRAWGHESPGWLDASFGQCACALRNFCPSSPNSVFVKLLLSLEYHMVVEALAS